MEQKSTHQVLTVPIQLTKHPDADSLSLVSIFDGGYNVVVRTSDWQDVKVGAYVVPDSIVDCTRPEFTFLLPDAKSDNTYRVRAKKLRGILSEGLLLPMPNDTELGIDLASQLGVKRYDPDEQEAKQSGNSFKMGGEVAKSPSINFSSSKYDIESWNKYKHRFQESEQVVITEKIHGTNARYLWINDQMYCGSRTEWKKEFPSYDHIRENELIEKLGQQRAYEIMDKIRAKQPKRNLWWEALHQNKFIEPWCKLNPGKILFGEVFGQVQNLKYTSKPGQLIFAAFDVMDGMTGKFYDLRVAEELGNMQWVPELYCGPYSDDIVREHTSGLTRWREPFTFEKAHIREGCVVRSLKEEVDSRYGRKVLKSVSSEYLSKEK